MRRRALLRNAALALTAAVAGCGGDDGDGTSTTAPDSTTTTPTTTPTSPPVDDVTSTAPLIDASMAALKLRTDELPPEENWTFQREDDNTTRFERQVELTSYRIVASVLAHDDLDTAVQTYGDERAHADAYTGIAVHTVDVGVEGFGYQLTDDEGTVVFRDANVVGELIYGLGQFEPGRGTSTALGEVVTYARTWHATWR